MRATGIPYAYRSVYGEKIGSKRNVLMHRIIMGAKKGEYVDHKNGDGLDNRKENLRICTNAQNAMNSKVSSKNTSGYKGVYLHSDNKNWIAQIRLNGKTRHIGSFKDKKLAAMAYDSAAINFFGEFARTNF